MNEESGQPAMNDGQPDGGRPGPVLSPVRAIPKNGRQWTGGWQPTLQTPSSRTALRPTPTDRRPSASVSVDVEAALAAVRARLDAPSRDHLQVVRGWVVRGTTDRRGSAQKTVFGVRGGRVVLAAAAAVVAWIGVRSLSPSQVGGDAAQVVATRVGQRDSVVLSDGSRVVLAPGSRLTATAGFASGDRTVTLEGAAYFDVKHDDAHPFTVMAAGAEIRDVGTAFTVKTDATGGVAVAVTHGIVTVRGENAPTPDRVELRAGDRGVVTKGTVAVTRGSVTEEETTWTRGQLAYRDTPLSEVQADLRRWFGVQVIVEDSALARLTVTMPAQSDSATVINTIVRMLGAEMVQRGDSILLRAVRGSSSTP